MFTIRLLLYAGLKQTNRYKRRKCCSDYQSKIKEGSSVVHVWVGDKEPRDATQKQVVQLMSRTLNFIKVKQLHIQLKKKCAF